MSSNGKSHYRRLQHYYYWCCCTPLTFDPVCRPVPLLSPPKTDSVPTWSDTKARWPVASVGRCSARPTSPATWRLTDRPTSTPVTKVCPSEIRTPNITIPRVCSWVRKRCPNSHYQFFFLQASVTLSLSVSFLFCFCCTLHHTNYFKINVIYVAWKYLVMIRSTFMTINSQFYCKMLTVKQYLEKFLAMTQVLCSC